MKPRRSLLIAAAVLSASAQTFAEPPRAYHNALELQQGWAWAGSEPSMERWGPTFTVQYWLRDAFAIGIRGMVYTHDIDTDFNFQQRRATRVPVMLDEYQWQTELTVTYAFLHGGGRILHFDAYALAGTGVLSARPIPIIDPDRYFHFRLSGSFGGGLGLRLFVTRWFATGVEVRDFVYLGRHENPAPGASWYGPTTLTDNVQLQIGFSFFAPVPAPP